MGSRQDRQNPERNLETTCQNQDRKNAREKPAENDTQNSQTQTKGNEGNTVCDGGTVRVEGTSQSSMLVLVVFCNPKKSATPVMKKKIF